MSFYNNEYTVIISKNRNGRAEELFRFNVRDYGRLREDDNNILNLVRGWCKEGISVVVDPREVAARRDGSPPCFISYRSHDGEPFKKITFSPGSAAHDITEIPWDQL